ncbi:MAG: hypothetical protein AAGN82_07345 [Myxococcota bacterium]
MRTFVGVLCGGVVAMVGGPHRDAAAQARSDKPAAAAALPPASSPPSASASEAPEVLPPGVYPRLRGRRDVLVAGSVTLGVSWVLTGVAGAIAIADRDDDAGLGGPSVSAHVPLFVPVAGPFLAAATLDPGAVGTGALLVDGLVQTAGLGMLIGAFVAPERVLRPRAVPAFGSLQPVVIGVGAGVAPGIGGRW